ncbi:MAG: NAD-dependent epimerase [Deltaproteobacteria bacterium]|nr:NAD-dependent epimerase [Deltaproteobacteria bacterium]
MNTVLVTGTAGFIGYHLTKRLLAEGVRVVGVDNVNDYYDLALKEGRLADLADAPQLEFHRMDLVDRDGVAALFAGHRFDAVVHLAAQAGVRYSLTHPHAYVDNNVTAFLNVLEGCRHQEVPHLLYASSSSVYGANTGMPFSEHKPVAHPVSLYAATKRANELMAHSYAHIFRTPVTGMRFFTVYGPWGRPDMAMFLFTKAILQGEPIPVFNYGEMVRDFTYVGDVVEGITRLLRAGPSAPNPEWDSDAPDIASSSAPFRIFNIGNNSPVRLMDMIRALEVALDRPAQVQMMPLQPGDVPATYADCSDLVGAVGYRPSTAIQAGVNAFVRWYRDFYKV